MNRKFTLLATIFVAILWGCSEGDEIIRGKLIEEVGKETQDSTILSAAGGIEVILYPDNSIRYEDELYVAGDTIFGYKDYVYLIVGNTNTQLILSSPHDGNNNGSPVIPDRITTDATVRDLNTTPLCAEIAKEYQLLSGTAPFTVVNTIWRRKVEPNRASNETDHVNEDAIATYNSYHRLANVAKLIVNHVSGKGFFADIHGHGLAVQRVHVGYSVPREYFYRSREADLGDAASLSSIRAIAQASPLHFDSLSRGSMSLGGMLVAQGIRAYPSPVDVVSDGSSDKYTTSGNTYWNGAFNVAEHGSRDGGQISAAQFEFFNVGIRNNAANRAAAGQKVGTVLYEFLSQHGVLVSND